APLVVPEHGGVRVQVAVGGPSENGSRTVEIHAQREGTPGDGETWTRHATGTLSDSAADRGSEHDFAAWPPLGAKPVEAGDFYGGLAERGYEYGPAFQGVRTVWRRGEEVFAEVALPEEQRKDAVKFGIHPALLDAALHAHTLSGTTADGDTVRQPLDWNGLVLHAAGASALRVRLLLDGSDVLSLEAADETGGLVVSADSLVMRALSAEQLAPSGDTVIADSLFRVEWTELPTDRGAVPAPSWAPVASAEDVAALAGTAEVPAVAVLEAVGGDGEDSVLALTSRVLEVVQAWLGASGLEESRLVVATRGAVPAGSEAAVSDPAGAAVWGLVRAAQSENPDRIVLLDTDPAAPASAPASGDAVAPVLGAALAGGEPQLAVRGTALSVPRLARATVQVPDAAPVFGPEGTVLITGGTGSLGALAARHLVSRYGVRRLVLAGRRGPAAEGARELVAELTELGAEVSVVACDVSDRAQAEALLASVPDEHPLRGVVHTAGVLDAGVIGALTPERLARVFAPKVDAVR
ncbi:SDR family oxidoreductase, partial [Streptomyces yokosukanensis]|uniref:SDR family oxidoreductase n=1 Tax=Streptomyces yokosukanensis TaxID=67386 RepID=UPI003449D1C4